MKKLLIFTSSFLVSQCIIVFLALFKPSANLSPYVSGYPVHMVAVFITVILLYLTLKRLHLPQPKLLASSYGILISVSGELIQSFLPYRSFDIMDIAAGVGATILAIITIIVYQHCND